jgi:hypothetical protein
MNNSQAKMADAEKKHFEETYKSLISVSIEASNFAHWKMVAPWWHCSHI